MLGGALAALLLLGIELLQRCEQLARPMATADAVIAATELAHGAPLATRDVHDFAAIGLTLINPCCWG